MPSPYITAFTYGPPHAKPYGSLIATLSDGTFMDIDQGAAMALINPSALVQYAEGLITESGAGTYTLTLTAPAGSTVRDATVVPETAWDSGTSATLNAGEAGGDTDNYFTAVDMKAQTTEMSLLLSSTGSGDLKGTEPRYASSQAITFVIVSVGTGSAGRTRCRLYYSVPGTVLAAVKT
jgi:hypothetical protein